MVARLGFMANWAPHLTSNRAAGHAIGPAITHIHNCEGNHALAQLSEPSAGAWKEGSRTWSGLVLWTWS